jgi:hypothetical protein
MDSTSIIMVLFLIIGGYLLTTNQIEGSAKLILTILLVIVLVIFVINMSIFQSYTQSLDSAVTAKNAYTLDSTKYIQSSASYSISTWIYITNWTNDKKKYIMRRYYTKTVGTTTENVENPSLSLDQFKNDLTITFQTFDNDSINMENNTVHIKNISIQKWVNITVCFGDTNVDTYINGKLINTYITKGTQYYIPNSSSSPEFKNPTFDITPGGGFDGSISQCRFYNRFLTPQEAWNIYKSGVSSNFLNQYSAKFTFYNQQNPQDFWLF